MSFLCAYCDRKHNGRLGKCCSVKCSIHFVELKNLGVKKRRTKPQQRKCQNCKKAYRGVTFGITCSMECSEAFSIHESIRRGDERRPQLIVTKARRPQDHCWKKDKDPYKRGAAHTATQRAVRDLGFSEESKTADYLGCTEEEFIERFESLFEAGMSWANYGKGGWHIDHIVPVTWFDLSLEEHRLVCSNWLNLRPLWEKDNIGRGNRMTQAELENLHPDLAMLVHMLGVKKPGG